MCSICTLILSTLTQAKMTTATSTMDVTSNVNLVSYTVLQFLVNFFIGRMFPYECIFVEGNFYDFPANIFITKS